MCIIMSVDVNDEIVNDINSVSQPVAEILSVSQIHGIKEPVVLFYANRQVFRPFVYYKTADILLTTKQAYRWFSDGHLDICGVMLMALLMRTSRHLTFRDGFAEVLLKFSQDSQESARKYIEKSGFVDALGEDNIYKTGFFKTTAFKPNAIHQASMAETMKAARDEIMSLFSS